VNVRRLVVSLLLACFASVGRADPPPPGKLDKPPKLKRFVEAASPAELAERRRVDVVIALDVDEKGKVGKVELVTSGGPPFDEAALAAVRQFEFEPGEAGGKPVPVRITYRYTFAFKEPPPPPPPPPDAAAARETVPFSGRVLSKGDRVPLAHVAVILDEDELRAETDAQGRFAFDAVPIGEHKVHLRSPATTNADTKVILEANKHLETTYYVDLKNRYESTVRGRRPVEETIEHQLSGEEVRRIPGTQGDTIKAVQNLPGVARAPFNSGQLVVWGSSPFDTRTYVDGVYIPTPFHFQGLRATVNSELVDGVVFRPGGYNVEYGRGMGGVVEVQSRAPRKDGVHGFAQLDLIDASAMVEAGLPRNVSVAFALRRSTLDAWLPYVTPNQFQLTPTYWDYQAKVSWRPSPSTDLDVFVFGSDDQVRLVARSPNPNTTGSVDSHTFFHRALVRWTRRFGTRATLTITPSIGYDVPFQLRGAFGNIALEVDARTFEYSLRAVARVNLWKELRLDVGVDFEGNVYELSASGPISGVPREGDQPGMRGGGGFLEERATILGNHVAPFLALNLSLFGGRLIVVPQLRVDAYTFQGYPGTADAYSNEAVNVEPRLQARVRIKRWVALKGAVGVYRQPPDPPALVRIFGEPTVRPQMSIHYVLGADFDPTQTLHIETQLFYKELRELVVRGELGDPVLTNDGLGRVYGAEFLIRQQIWKGFFGWLAYTVSRAERREHVGDPWRLFQFDQTHILTLVASYKFPRGYQLGIRFRYVTGNPFTPVVGGYFDANDGQYRRIFGPQYSQRAADFHQLDLRFDKTWTFDRWKLAAYLDIQNLYYAKSQEGLSYNFDFTQSEPLAGLPIVPSFGIRGEF
jgi:TonB family protein